jgi:hypothetical protein
LSYRIAVEKLSQTRSLTELRSRSAPRNPTAQRSLTAVSDQNAPRNPTAPSDQNALKRRTLLNKPVRTGSGTVAIFARSPATTRATVAQAATASNSTCHRASTLASTTTRNVQLGGVVVTGIVTATATVVGAAMLSSMSMKNPRSARTTS